MGPETRALEWLRTWLSALISSRTKSYHTDDPAERRGYDIAAEEVLTALARVSDSPQSFVSLIKEVIEAVATPGSDYSDEIQFYALKHAYWCAGVAIGSLDGFNHWWRKGRRALDNGRVSSSIARERATDKNMHQLFVDPAAGDYLIEFSQLIPDTCDVAAANQIRLDLLERATRSSKDLRRTVAVDQANSFIGGVHEGAWMIVGFLTEHPPVE